MIIWLKFATIQILCKDIKTDNNTLHITGAVSKNHIDRLATDGVTKKIHSKIHSFTDRP